MKLDRYLAVFAALLSVAAMALAVQAMKRDPLGTGLSTYNLSSPEATLQSIHAMVERQDARAGWQLFKTLLQADANPDTKLFLSDGAKIKVLKSVEVANSAGPKNNGLVVSFITFNVAGVDYRTIHYFRKDQSNRFLLGETFYVPYGTEKNEQDKSLEAQIEEFKKTGKL